MKLRNGKVILQICSATWELLPRKLLKEVDYPREQTLLCGAREGNVASRDSSGENIPSQETENPGMAWVGREF